MKRRLTYGLLLAMAIANAQRVGAQPSPPPKPELQFVVALFRHGVRAPLEEFANKSNCYAGQCWPASPSDWGATRWGDLTGHGRALAVRVGENYFDRYRTTLPPGFKVYLWADVDSRTKDTAEAIAEGFRKKAPVNVVVESRPGSDPDPLFHAFKAGCAAPDPSTLNRLDKVAGAINRNWRDWANEYSFQFRKLSAALACGPTRTACALSCSPAETSCTPLEKVNDVAVAWDGKDRKSPVKWGSMQPGHPGRFSYASSASEAFLLEYANDMTPVGWGRVATQDLPVMMRLHEFYFDKTERDPYLALIDGSNLVREISDQINQKAERTPLGQCPRDGKDKDVRFVGLVGHDTNLAAVGALLNMHWSFSRAPSQFDMPDLPGDDALPAGALVFELYKGAEGYSVQVVYITQSPRQMRDGGAGEPFAFRARCTVKNKERYPCALTLDEFDDLVSSALGPGNPFLSHCKASQQTCTLQTPASP